jgi:hypothetical protein
LPLITSYYPWIAPIVHSQVLHLFLCSLQVRRNKSLLGVKRRELQLLLLTDLDRNMVVCARW